jgi:hypothetical protein
MHRSGTSALAGAISYLGVNFVSPNDELPRTISNPNGYFERPLILNFSDLMLSTQEWTWSNVNLLPFKVEKTSSHVYEARQIIDELSTAGLVGLKDPRICLLMPFWRRVLLDRFATIVITRDPAEVAWSLHVRDGFPVATGLALWIAYSAHLANGIQGLSSHVLRYEDLINHPTAELTTIAEFLLESGVPISNHESNVEVAAKSIDPTLCRPTFPDWLETHPLTIEARSIRELFHQTSAGDISFNPSELCREILDFQTNTQALLESNHHLNLARAEIHKQRDSFQLELTQASNDYVKAVVTLEEMIEKLDTEKTDLEQKSARLNQIEQSFSWKLGLFLTWPIRKLRPSNRVPSRSRQ